MRPIRIFLLGSILALGLGHFAFAHEADLGTAAHASSALQIISPAPGEVIAGDKVKAIVILPDGFALDDYHVHLWLDTLPVHDSSLGVSLTDTTEHTFEGVFSGLHTLYAEIYRDDHAPMTQRLYVQVEFETVNEELKGVPKDEGKVEAPPDGSGGLFLPRGKGNTALAIILVVVALAILWFVFGRSRKQP